MEGWNEKLNTLIAMGIANCDEHGIDFDKLVKGALLGETQARINLQAEKQTRREMGARLRKWAMAVEEPLIPDLLDGFVEKDGSYIHSSQLSRKEWKVKILKLDQSIKTLVARRTAMQEAMEQAEEEER